MSGYFSRIARQSGVRFPRESGQPSVFTKKVRDQRRPLAIDLEETVMVAPDQPPESRASQRSGKRQQETSPVQRHQRKRSAEPSTKLIDPVTNKTSTDIAKTFSTEPVVDEVNMVEPDVAKRSILRGKASPDRPSEKERRPVQPNDARDPGKRQTDTAQSKTADKNFFERTTEIIEGQDAEPSEVQTILLRDVQQWIAAGPILTNDVPAEADPVAVEPSARVLTAKVERDPGIVRIVGRQPAEVRTETTESSSSPPELREQNFEISIGSISVVVEGEEQVKASGQAAVAAPSVASETPRRPSRLSRHYL